MLVGSAGADMAGGPGHRVRFYSFFLISTETGRLMECWMAASTPRRRTLDLSCCAYDATPLPLLERLVFVLLHVYIDMDMCFATATVGIMIDSTSQTYADQKSMSTPVAAISA